MDEELKGIIQRMIDAGEPEENIGKVIQSYKAQGLSEVKKKDETEVSDTSQKPTTTTSDTDVQEQPQPSDTSSLEGQTFSNYPGKETNEYKFVDGDWQWREKKKPKKANLLTAFAGSGSGYTEWKTVENEGRISALNNYYGKKSPEQKSEYKDAPEYVAPENISEATTNIEVVTGKKLSAEEEEALKGNKIFTGYPGRETNEYYTKNGEWFKRTEDGDGSFKKLTNKGSIDGLNKQFLSKDAQEASKTLFAYKAKQENTTPELSEYEIKQEERKAKRNEYLEGVDSELIGAEEEEVVKILQAKYGEDGFTFKEAGGGDSMTVKPLYGESITIDLDPYSSKTEQLMAGTLRNFLWENKTDKKVSWSALKDQMIDPKTVVSKEWQDAADAVINNKLDLAAKTLSTYIKRNQEFDELYLKQGGKFTDEQRAAYEKNIDLFNKASVKAAETIKLQEDINIAAGYATKHAKSRNEQLGSTGGALVNSALKGVEDIVSGAGALAVTALDVLDEGASSWEYMYTDADAKVYMDNMEEYYDRSKDRKATIEKIQSTTKDALTSRFGSATMDEYIASEDRSTLMKATTGVVQSIPAMATGFGGMFLQSFDAVAKEWVDNPNYEDMPLHDLLAVGGSIAAIQGTLEKVGLTSALSKNSFGRTFTNKVVQKTLGKITGKTTQKKFKDLLAAETNSMLANGAVRIVGGALAEGETGALQEVADISIKKLYNASKGETIFEEPENVIEAVAEGAMMEAIGGAMMSGAAQSTRIVRDGLRASKIDKRLVDALHSVSDSPEMKRSLVKKMKMDIINGKITKEEADAVLNDYNEMMTTMRSIPTEISDKSEAFDLLVEKKKIEKEMEGKESDLVVDKKARVDEISTRLQELTAPATEAKTKQENEQVKVHSESGGSSISQSGENLYGKPGYSVSTHTDKTKTVKGKEITQEELDQYKEDNKEALKDPNNFVGTWYDSETDQTYIDIATRVEDKQQAIDLGKANNQKAIFDLESGTEIDTGGTGEVNTETVDKPKTGPAKPSTPESSKAQFIAAKGERKQKVFRAVHNVTKALKSVPGVKVYVHETTDAYNSAIAKTTGESKEAIDAETQKSTGEYLFGKKEIHINLDNATSGTVYHEAFHAIFEAKGFSEAKMKSFVGNVKKISNLSASTIAKLDRFADNYTAESAIAAENSDRASKGEPKLSPKEEAKVREEHVDTVGEEFVAELFSDLATDATTMSASNLQKLINLVNKLAKSIGLGVVLRERAKRQEVIDFLNKTATDLSAGTEVDLETEINTGSLVRKKRKIGFFDIEYFEDSKDFKELVDKGLVVNNYNLSDIDGEHVAVHQPDNMFVGTIKHKGKEIFKGGGGVFYVPNTGNVWASGAKSSANSLAKLINESFSESTDGVGRMLLVRGTDSKMISSSEGVKASMSLLEMMVDKNLIARRDFRSSLVRVGKEFGVDFSGASSASSIHEDIQNKFMNVSESTFQKRGDFFDAMLVDLRDTSTSTKENIEGIRNFLGSTRKISFGKAGIRDSIGEILTERLLSGLPSSHVYAVVEVNSEVEVIENTEHGSYPFVIKAKDGSEPVLKLLKDRSHAVKGEQLKLVDGSNPTQAKLGLAQRGMGKARVSTPRKKRVMPKNESDKLTSDKDGNYYFENFSHSKKTKLKPSLATGVGTQTSREEREAINSVGGLTMLYTMKGQTEKGVGSNKHKVVIPKDKVYYVQSDVNNYYEEAKRQFQEARPGQAFSPNYQAAWITKVANENGYDVAVVQWRGDELRAQTTSELIPTESDTEFNERSENVHKVGDTAIVFGYPSKITKIDGPIYHFEGDGGNGSFNIEKSPRSIRKKRIARPANEVNKKVTNMKDEGMKDSEIKSQLKSEMYTDKEVRDAITEYGFKKEGIFVNKDGGKSAAFMNAARKIRRKWFLARKFMPKSVFYLQEQTEARIARHLNRADKLVKDFTKFHKRYDGDKEKLVEDFDGYIRGDKTIKLPKELLAIANSMRNQVDSLSQMLIDSGIADEETTDTIKANLGKYLNKSYKLHDRANWKNEVSDEVKQAAKNFLRKQDKAMIEARAEKNGTLYEDEMENHLENTIDELLTEDVKAFQAQSRKGAKDISVFKSQQDIPAEIRALMGEYKDPAMIYARTVMKLATLSAHHKFLSQVKQQGMGVFLFEPGTIRPKEYNVQISAEGSEAMAPLNGLYTSPEIKAEFEAQINEVGELISTWMKLVSAIKWSKTIGSVATHAKNIIGNLSFLAINGHVNFSEFGKSYNTVQNDFRSLNRKGQREKMEHYISLGIVKQSAGLGEIKDMFKDANWDTALAARLSTKDLSLAQKLKRFSLQQKKVLEDAYQAEDDFFKIIAYESELKRYAKATLGKKVSELTKEERANLDVRAAEIVKNTLPTYSRVPEAIQKFRRSPLIGSFVAFTAESYRTGANTALLAFSETKNPETRAIGVKRFLGASTYMTAKTAIITYGSWSAGVGFSGMLGSLLNSDEEDQKDTDMRKFVAEWSKESDIIYSKAGDGKFTYTDFSAADPHGAFNKVITALLKGEDSIDSIIDGAKILIEPFVGTEIATDAVLGLYNNKDGYGRDIYNVTDSWFDQVKSIVGFLKKVVEPGTITSVDRIINSKTKGTEIIGAVTGYRTREVDVNQQVGFAVKDVQELIANAKRPYNTAYRKFSEGEITKAEMDEAYKNAKAKVNEYYNELIELYNSAERLGVNPDALFDTFNSQGISKENLKQIQIGETPGLKNKDDEASSKRKRRSGRGRRSSR